MELAAQYRTVLSGDSRLPRLMWGLALGGMPHTYRIHTRDGLIEAKWAFWHPQIPVRDRPGPPLSGKFLTNSLSAGVPGVNGLSPIPAQPFHALGMRANPDSILRRSSLCRQHRIPQGNPKTLCIIQRETGVPTGQVWPEEREWRPGRETK